MSRDLVSQVFSRDGTRIAYKNQLGGSVASASAGAMSLVDIIVADPDGSNPVIAVHEVAAGNPMWSPDGRWLSYSGADDHAFVVAADGSGKPIDLGKFDAGAWTPSWSPDSERLAVAVGDGTLWVVDRDGSDARRLTHGEYAEVGEQGWSADWSPDGAKLLFGAGDPDLSYDLYLVGLDGAPEVLVDRDANNGVWSPDGTMFAYVRAGSPRPVVVVSDAAITQRRVLRGHYGWFMPAWSPDQTRIAILDDRPGPADLPGPPEIAMLDPQGVAPSVTLSAGTAALGEDDAPDATLTWQRLAP